MVGFPLEAMAGARVIWTSFQLLYWLIFIS